VAVIKKTHGKEAISKISLNQGMITDGLS